GARRAALRLRDDDPQGEAAVRRPPERDQAGPRLRHPARLRRRRQRAAGPAWRPARQRLGQVRRAVPPERQRPAAGAARPGRQGARAPFRRARAVAARDLRAHGRDREREARRGRRRTLMANKALPVAQREYLENVRTKTFWIGILAFPAIFAISIG